MIYEIKWWVWHLTMTTVQQEKTNNNNDGGFMHHHSEAAPAPTEKTTNNWWNGALTPPIHETHNSSTNSQERESAAWPERRQNTGTEERSTPARQWKGAKREKPQEGFHGQREKFEGLVVLGKWKHGREEVRLGFGLLFLIICFFLTQKSQIIISPII